MPLRLSYCLKQQYRSNFFDSSLWPISHQHDVWILKLWKRHLFWSFNHKFWGFLFLCAGNLLPWRHQWNFQNINWKIMWIFAIYKLLYCYSFLQFFLLSTFVVVWVFFITRIHLNSSFDALTIKIKVWITTITFSTSLTWCTQHESKLKKVCRHWKLVMKINYKIKLTLFIYVFWYMCFGSCFKKGKLLKNNRKCLVFYVISNENYQTFFPSGI